MPHEAKPYWGPQHLPDLPEPNQGCGGLLIVRHSERDPIKTVAEAYTARLTHTGRAMARAFGVQLGRKFRIGALVASPVERCVETAQEILAGALTGSQSDIEIQSLPVLHFEQKLTGIAGLENIFLDDPGFIKLVSNPESSEYALLRQTLLETLPFPQTAGVTNLAVTHDVVIAFLRTSLLGLPDASLTDFPDYLEGIFLVKTNAGVKLL